LNLRFIDDREHFFWLSFCGGEKARSEASGGEDGLANFSHGRSVRNRAGGIGGHQYCEVRTRIARNISFAQYLWGSEFVNANHREKIASLGA
jgi:hypothetical protein